MFADLRGYSDYVERQGDHAGVALLNGYRILVRSTVGRYEGAEIRTEGDNFFVVFPSASRAVSCGMDIVARATAAEPPIRVGVGIHAGEAADTGEGPVGSAVNIAARVCAQARAGELLVTDMVRLLTRTLVPFRFVPRGTPVLKGIAEPMPLFRVIEPGDGPASLEIVRGAMRPTSTRWIALVALVGTVAVVLLGSAALMGLRLASGPSPASSFGIGSTSATTNASGIAASPTASSAGAASPSRADFPTGAETSLLQAIPASLAKNCVRGPYDVMSGDRSAIPLASLACTPSDSTGANKVVVRRFSDPGLVVGIAFSTDTVVAHIVGSQQLRPGECASGPQASGRWQRVGQDAGAIACYVDRPTGDAILVWSDKLHQILVQATNQRGDSKALYAYFEEVAPFIVP
jgi:Adenylate and Guanylate cyclase catalytic domain